MRLKEITKMLSDVSTIDQLYAVYGELTYNGLLIDISKTKFSIFDGLIRPKCLKHFKIRKTGNGIKVIC